MNLTHSVRSTNLPKSNSPGFGIGGALCGLACVVAATLDKASSAGWGRLLPLRVCCLPFAIALTELRSGCAWENLAPGNRGVQRTTCPAKFFRSVIFHFLLAAIIAGYGVCLSCRP